MRCSAGGLVFSYSIRYDVGCYNNMVLFPVDAELILGNLGSTKEKSLDQVEHFGLLIWFTEVKFPAMTIPKISIKR